MADWIPYLRPLYATDADDEIHTLLRYCMTIPDPRLQPSDRAEIIDWFAEQAPSRQLFALPKIVEVLAHRSSGLTKRVILFVDELLGHGHSATLERVREHLGGSSPSDYTAVYDLLGSILLSVGAPPSQGDFTALAEHRDPVALLALLLGVETWRQAQEGQQPAKFAAALSDSAGIHDLEAHFDVWLRSGHAFVRYLLVRWVELSGKSTFNNRPVDELLRATYKEDRAPLVAGAALEALAERKHDIEDASRIAPLLLEEYDTLAAADRKWERGVDPIDATRDLSASILRAISILVRRHPDSAAMDVLRTIVTAVPDVFLNVLDSEKAIDPEDTLHIFRAALRLRHKQIRVRLRPGHDGVRANAGLSRPVSFVDPRGLREKFPRETTFWAEAEASDLEDPCAWTFTLAVPCSDKKVDVTTNLRRLLSPALTYERTNSLEFVKVSNRKLSALRPERGTWILQDFVEEEIDDRGAAMVEAYKLLTELVGRESADASDRWSWALRYLWQVAIASSCAVHGPALSPRSRLKDMIVRSLLNELARPEVFDLFISDDERPDLEYRLLGLILHKAARSVPGDSGLRWVLTNWRQLLVIAWNERVDRMTRGRVAVALSYAADDLPEEARAEIDVLELPPDVVKKYTPAVRFVTENNLAQRLSAGSEWPKFGMAGHDAAQWGAIWMERLARVLTNHPDRSEAVEVEDAAARVIRIIAMMRATEGMTKEQLNKVSQKQQFEQGGARATIDMCAFRLAAAIGQTTLPVVGNLRRLRDLVLRSPNVAVLRQYIRNRRTAEFDSDWVRILVRLLERSDLRSQDGGVRSKSIHEIVDRLSRRRTILLELSHQAAVGGHEYFTSYRHLRRLDVLPGEVEGWIACEGEVLAEDAGEKLAILREFGAEAPIELASNTSIAAFVDQPEHSQRFHCLATRLPLPPDAIDFHALDVAAEERLSFALECLSGRTEIVAVGRVNRIREDSVEIDSGLPGATVLDSRMDLRVRDRVLVRLRHVKSVVAADISLIPGSTGSVQDLRRSAGTAVAELERLLGKGPILLCATIEARAEAAGSYRVHVGFRVGPQKPVITIPGNPKLNSTVVVTVARAQYATDRAVGITSVDLLPETTSSLIKGSLRATSPNATGRREWSSGYGSPPKKIARRALTADLSTLYAVDAIPDGDSRLQNIMFSAAVDKGEPSLLAAPPRYTTSDLLLATAAGEVEAIVYVRSEADISAIFEIIPYSRTREQQCAIPLFGALVRVREGELFHENGRPFALSGRRGQRLHLSVSEGLLQLDGSWRPAEAGATGAPSLRVTLSDVNGTYEEAFRQGEAVRLRYESGQTLRLKDIPAGLPHPTIKIDFVPRPGAPIDAIVKSWDAFAPDLRIELTRPRTRDFDARADRLQALVDWAYAQRGSILQAPVRFWEAGPFLNMTVFGCRVVSDWTLQWLTPSRVTAQALNDSYARAQAILITDAPRPYLAEALDPVRAADFPIPPDRSVGVVVSTPHQEGLRSGAVQWLVKASDDDIEVNPPFSYDIPKASLEKVYVGDLVYARSRNDIVELQIGHRQMRGTPLCKRNAAPLVPRGKKLRATFLAEPSDERPDGAAGNEWLFVVDPGVVIEIPRERLTGGNLLEGRHLDIALLTPGERQYEWRVESVEAGHLAAAGAHPFDVQLKTFPSGTFAFLTSTHPEFRDWPDISLRTSAQSLPRVRPGSSQQCSLRDFAATIDLREDDLFELEIEAILAPPRPTISEKPPELPSLLDELRENGRLDDVEGTVIKDPSGEIFVRVLSHRHPAPLSLSRKEETWVPYSRERVRPDAQRRLRFAVVADDNGEPLVSLRRRPPLPLADWLKEKRVSAFKSVDDKPLTFVGVIDDAIRRACDTEQAGVLFEYRPGDCVVVLEDDLLFRGELLDTSMLAPGEIIESYHILRPTLELVRLDAIKLRHDIVDVVQRFTDQKGILVVDTSPKLLLREQLRMVVADEPVNFGERTLRIEGVDEGKSGLIYARYERHHDGVLHCRALSLEEAFAPYNVVYVRGVKVIPLGDDSLRAVVEPFGEKTPGHYFIADTRYSERRWYLQTAEVGERTFLAQVVAQTEQKSDGTYLALTLAPFRRLGSVLRAVAKDDQAKQVLVTRMDLDDEYVDIELAPGFNGSIPFSRIEPREMIPDLRKGDILFLTISKRSKVEVVRRIESHREWLKAETHPTVLAKLWGRRAFRELQINRRDYDGLKANVVGFPQLKARSEVKKEHIESTGLLPQMVQSEDPEDDFIQLADRVGGGVQVGKLKIDASAPRLVLDAGTGIDLTWANTVVRFDCHDELRQSLRRWRWRDFANEEESLAGGQIIATGRDGRFSLTRSAAHPYPVDHLVEQFGLEKKTGTLVFTVAQADRNRVVLEIAPGRYVEVPALMIESLTSDRLASGLRLDWSWLSEGDRVHLELRPSRTHPYLPNVAVQRVETSVLRQLRKGAFGPVRRQDGHLLFGAVLPNAIHVDDLTASLEDVILDLHRFPAGSRADELSRAWRGAGSRLVLVGGVVPTLSHGGETRVDIGVPVRDNHFVDPSAAVSGGPEFAAASVRVRIYRCALKNGVVEECRYQIEPENGADWPVRITARDMAQRRMEPLSGDCVAIYAPQAPDTSDIRVCGMEELTIEWVNDHGDGLRLNRRADRDSAFACLLSTPGALLWMTLENVNRSQGVVRLSRRKQLEMVAAHEGGVVRGVVRGGIGARRVAIEVAGVPLAMAAEDLCFGLRDAGNYGGFLAKDTRRAQLDVLVRPGPVVAATPVYPRVAKAEFLASIDFVAPNGLICICNGMRVFVPIWALAWCELSVEAMQSIFRRGQKILLRRTDDDFRTFSHVRNSEHLREAKVLSDRLEQSRPHVDEMPRDDEPLFVKRRFIEKDKKQAIVSTSAGMLIVARFESETDLDDRQIAYLEEVDLRRCRITASVSRAVLQKWRFPAARVPDIWREEDLKKAIGELIDLLLPFKPVEAVEQFFAMTRVPPTPRSIRVMLDLTYGLPVSLGSSEPTTPFARTWAGIAAVLAGGEPADALSAFGSGYWLLISGAPERAVPHLEVAASSEALQSSFDVQLSLARALFESRQSVPGTRLLRNTCRRLAAQAHGTMRPPLINIATGPHAEAVMKAADRRSVRELRESFAIADRKELVFAEAKARQIWGHLATATAFPADFDALIKDFLEALSDEEDLDMIASAALYSLAAQLSFACGDTARGRVYLERTATSQPDEWAIERSWDAWLRRTNAKNGNPVVDALRRVLTEVAWRRTVTSEAFLSLWTEFRKSTREWVLATAPYRIVSPPPIARSAAIRWALTARATPALPFILNSVPPDDVEVEVPASSAEETVRSRPSGKPPDLREAQR